MNWQRTTKTISAIVLLAFGLYGAFLTGQLHPSQPGNDDPATSSAAGYRRLVRNFSNDGRFGTDCKVCSVSIFRLIAVPERYDQKTIRTSGFLKAVTGTTIKLFPTTDSVQVDGYYENINISGDISDELRAKLKDGVWVQVSGRFDATDELLFSVGGIFDAHIEDQLRPDPLKPPTVILKGVEPRPAIPPQFETLPNMAK